MAVANLRSASSPLDHLEEALSGESADNLTIEQVTCTPVDPIVEDYPYEQDVYRGTAIYHEPSTYTPGRDIELEFEFRDKSGLFLVELQTDVASVDDIAGEISESVSGSLRIYRNLHAAEDALWDFFQEANRVIEISVLKDGREIPYREVEEMPVEEVVGNLAIESAQVGFSIQGHDILVSYHSGEIQVRTDWEDGREYIIQLFEREVLYPE